MAGGRLWTKAEDDAILRGIAAGLTNHEIYTQGQHLWPDRQPPSVYKRRSEVARDAPTSYPVPDDESIPSEEFADGEALLLTESDIARITSLEDLVTFFKVDTELWEVRDFRVNKWEQHSVKKGVVPLYQVRANFVPNKKRIAAIEEQVLEQLHEDMQSWSPTYPKPPKPQLSPHFTEPVAWVESVNDAHFGMLAWGEETGQEDYDLGIANRDFGTVIDKLYHLAGIYNLEHVVITVGHDLQHIDTLLQGKIGATTRGTPQDYDSRLPKIMTAIRRAVVAQIDRALTFGVPVTVVPVKGNHDTTSNYSLAEVLAAWYRQVEQVEILNTPTDENPNCYPRARQYLRFGENGFMFTHGEEFKRRREPLALLFADEAPEIWAATKYREVLCGHWHGAATQSMPISELSETRAVRIRSLPGLTPIDAWHYNEGYRHWRAATGIAYKEAGGVAGIHEVEP